MSFIKKLHSNFDHFYAIIDNDGHNDVLSMPYAEYSLQCFVIYKDRLFEGLLHQDGELAQAFRAIGVEQPRDQLVIFLETFYLYQHTKTEQND